MDRGERGERVWGRRLLAWKRTQQSPSHSYNLPPPLSLSPRSLSPPQSLPLSFVWWRKRKRDGVVEGRSGSLGMNTIYLVGAGTHPGWMEIDEDWKLTLTKHCGARQTLETVGVHHVPAFGCLFFFGYKPRVQGQVGWSTTTSAEDRSDPSQVACFQVVEHLPEACKQMLLYSPVVPLLQTDAGFQNISEEVWMSLVMQGTDTLFADEATLNASPYDRPLEGEEEPAQSESSASASVSDSQALCEELPGLEDDDDETTLEGDVLSDREVEEAIDLVV